MQRMLQESRRWQLLLTIILITAFGARLDAARYIGEISGVAEGGMEEFFYYWDLGETWTLKYSYESDSIDGSFTPHSGGLKVRPVHNIGIDETTTFNFPFGPLLEVNGSVVTGFSMTTDPDVWYITESWWNFDGFGGGSVTITDPRHVPDSASTAGMTLLAFAGLAAARSRFAGAACKE